MNCSKCKKDIADLTAKFCPHCGHSTELNGEPNEKNSNADSGSRDPLQSFLEGKEKNKDKENSLAQSGLRKVYDFIDFIKPKSDSESNPDKEVKFDQQKNSSLSSTEPPTEELEMITPIQPNQEKQTKLEDPTEKIEIKKLIEPDTKSKNEDAHAPSKTSSVFLGHAFKADPNHVTKTYSRKSIVPEESKLFSKKSPSVKGPQVINFDEDLSSLDETLKKLLPESPNTVEIVSKNESSETTNRKLNKETEKPTVINFPVINNALWEKAESEIFQVSGNAIREIEISYLEIAEFKQSEHITLLFDLVEKELVLPLSKVSPEQSSSSKKTNIKQVQATELNKAFSEFKTEVKKLAEQPVVLAEDIPDLVPEVDYVPANFIQRVQSTLIDLSISFGIAIVIGCLSFFPVEVKRQILTLTFKDPDSIYLYSFDCLMTVFGIWLISTATLIFTRGQTFGQRYVGTKAITRFGPHLSFPQSLLWTCNQLTTLLTFGIALIPFRRTKRFMHDILADVHVQIISATQTLKKSLPKK
jgi:uncharacterized RDD family membrane protein YckC